MVALKLRTGGSTGAGILMRKTTTKIVNIKKYMLAALFNAPTTIDGYYRAEVNHDMPQFAG